MTAITRNLPWFVRDLGTAIIGEKCYETLVLNLDVDDVECLKYSLSKVLGVGIVIGGSIMKVPQLLLIVTAQSARGISLPAYVLETLAYGITLAYSYRNNFPFSTYGENLFLTIQNIIITLLIIYYPSSRLTRQESVSSKLLLATVATGATGYALAVIPPNALSALQLATLPISLFSKLPQIRQNYRARSTGQLSAFAVIAQIAGCLARLFTTAAELGDALISAGFALALILNVVLGFQMWAYWGKDIKDEREEVGKRSPPVPIAVPVAQKASNWQAEEKVEVVIPPQSPSYARSGSPQIRHPSGRKWARKVD
ncbi:mannose-P-dolichol utilization defect 1 protein [Abortiporus biennis]|nr:mannose-P-dolichol utilization defect 1 protein [Abortiporus biennis]